MATLIISYPNNKHLDAAWWRERELGQVLPSFTAKEGRLREMKSCIQIRVTNARARMGTHSRDSYSASTILLYDANSQRQEIHFSGLTLAFPFGLTVYFGRGYCPCLPLRAASVPFSCPNSLPLVTLPLLASILRTLLLASLHLPRPAPLITGHSLHNHVPATQSGGESTGR